MARVGRRIGARRSGRLALCPAVPYLINAAGYPLAQSPAAVQPGDTGASFGGRDQDLMGDGFQFLDLIFFAVVAVFLVMRLRSVLGRRTGTEQPRHPFARAPGAGPP